MTSNSSPPIVSQDARPLSAVIITCNAASDLDDCLKSLDFVQEIIVVDSGSSDATVAIAQRYRAHVIQHSWLGFGPQKQFAIEQATHDWVLCIDADERISPALKTSLQNTLHDPTCRVYRMRRCNRFMGRYLRHGEGYPDWNIRLFDRRCAHWAPLPVHEHVITTERVGDLQGDLLHHSQDTLSNYLDKQNRYTNLQAEQMHSHGKKIGPFKIIGSPLVRFIRFYFFRLGFLDGVAGFTHIAIGCFFAMMKYAKCYALQLSRNSQK